MYERRNQPLISRAAFLWRMARHMAGAAAVVAGSLAVGTWGYHGLASLGYVDAFLNASMILTGMGPVNPLTNDAAKFFASGYALFSGIVFLAVMGLLLTPLLHRLLHSFHAS